MQTATDATAFCDGWGHLLRKVRYAGMVGTEPETDLPPIYALIEINPFFAFWLVPAMITQAIMIAAFTRTARRDAVERNPDPGQIPIPPNLQDSKDSELFA